MKNKKNLIYALVAALVVVSGLVFANREINAAIPEKPLSETLSVANKKAGNEASKLWENSPDGINFKLWENSPEGKKVNASHDKIRSEIRDFANMEAVVTSLTFRANQKGPKWVIVNIKGEEYMMQFSGKEFQKLNSLKLNDKIIVRSHSAGRSPNHPFLVLSGDHIVRNGKVLFVRDFNKSNRC